MKNKFLLSGLALCVATSLNATSLFVNDVNDHYKQFHKEIENFFGNDSLFNFPYKQYKIKLSNIYPKMNAFEEKDKYIFEFELAGIDKKDIKVTINDENILTIKGDKKEFTKEEKQNIIRQERHYGSFTRSLSLPDDIDSNKITINYKNGILKVTVLKDKKKIKKGIRTLSID